MAFHRQHNVIVHEYDLRSPWVELERLRNPNVTVVTEIPITERGPVHYEQPHMAMVQAQPHVVLVPQNNNWFELANIRHPDGKMVTGAGVHARRDERAIAETLRAEPASGFFNWFQGWGAPQRRLADTPPEEKVQMLSGMVF